MSTKKKQSVPTPKSDPRDRSYERGTQEMRDQSGITSASQTQYDNLRGTPMNVKDHPSNTVPTATEHYDGDQAYKDATSGFGQKTLYSLETGQMNSAVGVQDKVRSRFDDESN